MYECFLVPNKTDKFSFGDLGSDKISPFKGTNHFDKAIYMQNNKTQI